MVIEVMCCLLYIKRDEYGTFDNDNAYDVVNGYVCMYVEVE